jgi:integrase/recombinase XerD
MLPQPVTFKPATFQLAPDPWETAFSLWLASRPSAHTRRAYHKAWQLFLDFTHKQPPEIGRADVAAWIDFLRLQGLSPETIHQRLAALSSFYTYTMRTYTTVDLAGREQPLHTFNPAAAVPHPKTAPYGKARYLTADEARALLAAIPRHTLQGKRDYALFLAYLATGRRNSEIRLLRWCDFEFGSISIDKTLPEGKVFYRWTGKGKLRRDECPLILWDAIQSYLHAANRLSKGAGPLRPLPTDYIFIPLNDHASRFPCAKSEPLTANRPLSPRMLDRLVKKYARLASLDPDKITVHTLRHTAAMLRKQAGDDLESISSFLGHSTLAITQIYLHSVEGRHDDTWLKVADLLGLTTPLPLGRAGVGRRGGGVKRLPRRPSLQTEYSRDS